MMLNLPIPLWPSGMFKAIGTGGRGFEPRPGLAVPQKTTTGMAHFSIMWQGPHTMADEAFPGG